MDSSTGISKADNNFLSTSAVILAAGSSRRMGEIDKILVPLGGKPLLCWSVEAFERCSLISNVVIITNEANLDTIRKITTEMGWQKVSQVRIGGARRQDSVLEGIRDLEGSEFVAIHDGARPFLTPNLIRTGIEAAEITGAAIAAVPVKDTIKVVGENRIIESTPDRRGLWAAQTPQIFRLDIIRRAYQEEHGDVTDDASLLESSHFPVRIFEGSYFNIKVTTPEDLVFAEAIARQMISNRSNG